MVGEVNKIIYNMLVSGRGVYLPDVGSLYVERQAARKIATYKLLSPRNVVAFQSDEQAPSLVNEIVAVAGCSTEQATDIYHRWSAKTREGNIIKIGGVGVLNHKSFVMESEFASAINPKGVKTIVIRRRSNTWLYAICAACVLVALGFCAYIMFGGEPGSKIKNESKVVETVAQSAPQIVSDGVVQVVENESTTTVEPTDAATQVAQVADVATSSKTSQLPKAGHRTNRLLIAEHTTLARQQPTDANRRKSINDTSCKILGYAVVAVLNLVEILGTRQPNMVRKTIYGHT